MQQGTYAKYTSFASHRIETCYFFLIKGVTPSTFRLQIQERLVILIVKI